MSDRSRAVPPEATEAAYATYQACVDAGLIGEADFKYILEAALPHLAAVPEGPSQDLERATRLAERYGEAIIKISEALADGTKGGVMRARTVIAGLGSTFDSSSDLFDALVRLQVSGRPATRDELRDDPTFREARRRGYLSPEGYLTEAGGRWATARNRDSLSRQEPRDKLDCTREENRAAVESADRLDERLSEVPERAERLAERARREVVPGLELSEAEIEALLAATESLVGHRRPDGGLFGGMETCPYCTARDKLRAELARRAEGGSE